MDSVLRACCLSAMLLLIMVSDFSAMCKHQRVAAQGMFGYKSGLLSAHKSTDVSIVEKDNASTFLQWKQLEDVRYERRYNKEYNTNMMYPVFGKTIKKYAEKNVRISGYMIPLDMQDGLYAVSRFTYASCFFCGGAGVESVVSIKFKTKPPRFKTDQYCTVSGFLELNDYNVNDFIYILNNAVVVSK